MLLFCMIERYVILCNHCLLSAYLISSECHVWPNQSHAKFSIYLIANQIQILFFGSFPSLSCEFASVDVSDVLGTVSLVS